MKSYIAIFFVLLVASSQAAEYKSISEMLQTAMNNMINVFLKAPVDDYENTVGEFYKAAFGIDLPLETCRDNVEPTINNLQATLEQFTENRDVDAGFDLSHVVLNHAQELYHKNQECPELFAAFSQGTDQLLPILDNPLSLISAFKSAAMSSPFSFYGEFGKIQDALAADPVDFAKFGKASGTLFNKVLKKL